MTVLLRFCHGAEHKKYGQLSQLSIHYSYNSAAKWFRSYRILKSDFAADFCFWTELRLDGTQLFGLGLAETLEAPNTITVANSLSFPMVYNTVPNS
jgi:hypothetical protein